MQIHRSRARTRCGHVCPLKLPRRYRQQHRRVHRQGRDGAEHHDDDRLDARRHRHDAAAHHVAGGDAGAGGPQGALHVHTAGGG